MLQNIPVNVITGGLGAGKTTVIRHLLAHRPAGEYWAVLVNEFGEIGLDGALLAQAGVSISEVPGGCLCCANGVPFRVALNSLLKRAKPDRVLIEPTGLGHPLQLLQQLVAPAYHGVLSPQATLCVIDPVAARDPRISDGDIFRQQLASADLFIINHADRAAADDVLCVEALLQTLGLQAIPRLSTVRGVVDPAVLAAPQRRRNWFLLPPPADSAMHHAGAVWSADIVFAHNDMLSMLLALPVSRLKAVLHTDQGWLEINATPGISEWRSRDAGADSRVEVIAERTVGLPDLKLMLDTLIVSAGG